MDLELGLKITKTRDDIASISEYRLAKAGPIFQSRETNTMFILTAQLKGYKRNNIDIKISEDGSKISISGEKPVQNILMMGWLMHRKEVDVAGFNKVFKIPDGVKLDAIKAKYDEEEWILNILMPKLVKGICGVKIEEVKEESKRGRSELEKSEADQIFSNVGETSQKGSKESQVQEMEDNESFMEKKEGGVPDKMLDDANREIIKEKIQKEVEESKLGTGESSEEKDGMEGYEVMKASELEPNVGGGTSQRIGDISQKEIEESKLRIENGEVKGIGDEVGKTTYEAVKTSKKEKSVGKGMSQNIGDTSQDKEFEVQEMEDDGGFVEKEEKVITEKILDDANGNIIGEVQKVKAESKSGIEDRDGESVKEKIRKAGYKAMQTSEIEQDVSADVKQNIGDTNQRGVSKESFIELKGKAKRTIGKMEKEESREMRVEVDVSTEEETLGESKQKQFGEPKLETEDGLKDSSMELMKAPKLDQNIDDHIPSIIGGTSQAFKKSRIQQKEKTKSKEENMDEGETKTTPVEASKDSQKHIFRNSIKKDIKKPKIETEDEDQEYDGEKANKEVFDSMTIREECPKQLPKATIEENKGLSASKMQETEDVKEEKITRNSEEIVCFVDKDEGEESRRMHMEAKKDLTEKTLQKSEDVKEAKVKREGKEIEYVMNNSKGEESERMHMKAKKDLTKETTQEGEDVKEVMVKRESKEINYFLDESEGKEPKRMHMEAKKGFTTDTMQETKDVKEVMVKRKNKEIQNFADKSEGEEPRRMHVKAKDLTHDTIQESEEVKEEIVKRNGKDIQHSVDKSEGEELINAEIEAKNDSTKETVQEREGVKEEMAKRKGEDIEYSVNKDNGEEPKRIDMEAKKDLIAETLQETKDVKEVMVKRKDKEIKNFADKCEGKEPKKMHIEAKKDLTKETMQERKDVKEAMFKGKGKETEYFVVKGEREESKRMHMEAKKDLTTETMQENEYVKEAMGKRDSEEEIDYFLNKGEDEELNKIHMEAKELTTEVMQESEDTKEAIVKRKGKETKYFVDQGEDKGPKRILTDAKKDLTKKTTQEVEYDSEAMVKRKDKEIDYFVDKSEGEELKRTHMEAKKDITKETTQGEIEKIENEIKDSDQQNVLEKTSKGKFGVPTEELPKLVGKQDGSRGLKVAKMEEQKEMIKEAMVEIGSSMEKVKGDKSNTTGKITEKNTAAEILQKETEESNIARKSRDGPYVPNNIVKVVFEVSGTFQAKLPKQVMEVIAKDKKDKNEYVFVKLKGEGSIKMHAEPNEAFDEDETVERIEKEIEKSKLKSSDQISGKVNVDVVRFDGSKRSKFPEMGETKDVEEDNAKIEESVKKVNEDKYEKIQVEEKGGLRKVITWESTQTEREGSDIQTTEKDRHRLQEKMSKGRFEAINISKENFPLKMVDSLADKSGELKGTKIDEAKVAKEEELAKRKSEETNVVESATEEKVQVPESGRISITFKEVPEDKHSKVLEIRSQRRELQSTKGPTTCEKEVSVGFKEVEQMSAKDKTQKTTLLPSKIQSKETHESKKGVKQDIIKPKKEKEVEGEQCTYNIESTKEIARFPSTQQTKVDDKDKLYEGGKAEAFIESQKGDPTKGMKNLIEMTDNQEYKHRKTLKLEIPLEKHQKKGEPITRKDEFAKGQKDRETMQEETEGHQDKIVDRDQQHAQGDVAKGVGKVDTTGKEMPIKEYIADVGLVAKTMETKRDLKATPEREKYTIAQNFKDEKPRIQEKNIKGDVEKVDKKEYQTKAVEEGTSKGEDREEVVPEIKRERPKVAKSEAAKEASKLPHKREMGITTQTAGDKKPKIREITPEFEKPTGFKQAAEKMHESLEKEHQRDSEEVAPKREAKASTITPKRGVQKSTKEDMSPMPMAIQRKDPHDLSLSSKDYKMPKAEEVQQKNKGKRAIHALEATTSREEELAQATATHSKAKSEIDEPQVNQLPSPSTEMQSKEPHALEKRGMKEDDSKAECLVHMQEVKESLHSIEGTAASEVVADEVAEPSKFSSSSSTQPFEVEGKDKIDASCDEESQELDKDSEIDGQESTKGETDEEVEQRETLQPESLENSQFINKDQEESHGTHEIEEEKAYKQVDEADREDSQLLEDQKECEEEATGGKKNDQKRSKKLFVSMIIAGSAILASGIFLFIRHRRARKGGK